jgi:hypothetical protein
MRRFWTSFGAAAIVVTTAAGCTSTGTIGSAGKPLKPTSSGSAASPSPSDNVASKDFSTGSPSTPSSPTDSTTSTYGPPPAASVALVGHFMPYPTGAKPWVKNKTGPLAIREFIDDFYVADAQQDEANLAKTRGMQGVARHGWFNKDQTQTEVYLVKFSAAKGAQDMYADLLDSWTGKAAPIVEFDDAAVHGKGQVNPTVDDQNNATVKIAFTVGDTFVYVRGFSPSTPDKPGAMALALKQYTMLKTGH